jgi:hypothetical protein
MRFRGFSATSLPLASRASAAWLGGAPAGCSTVYFQVRQVLCVAGMSSEWNVLRVQHVAALLSTLV